MEIDGQEPIIDEGLYSRQIYTIGLDAMKKMAVSNVLIIGLKGLGVEIAKNVILAGVKSVSIYDPEPASIADLSSQFYLTEKDVGRPRDVASLHQLAQLNPYVPVSVISPPLSLTHLDDFEVVVTTSLPYDQFIEFNTYTHRKGIKFICCDTRGLTGFAFCDFGETFQVTDPTGLEPRTGMIAAISKEKEAIVTCLDESRHGLSDGDYVTFSEILGMTPLNQCPPMPIKVLGPFTFSIQDTSSFPAYERGGLFTQVKMPMTLHFQSLANSLHQPTFLISDFAKFDRPIQLHCVYLTLSRFLHQYQRLPEPCNESDAQLFLTLAHEVAKQHFKDTEFTLDTKLISLIATQLKGDVAPMAAVLGGFVAQEVLKACTGKLTPIQQYFYFDALEALPTSFPRTVQSCAPKGSRYDGQLAVFGDAFQSHLMQSKAFLVGAGAIGCEMLKNWAMMGVSAPSSFTSSSSSTRDTLREGKIYVTDMDSIEKSNLNRQFLFRSTDVSKLKSETAAKAVLQMNPTLNIQAFNDRVGPDSEALFNDAFWHPLTFVVNALDNVEARRYVDRRCVLFRKALFDSGTMGTQGSTQVVIPHLTESYGSSQDPPEKSIPMCTLKNFPNQIEHTIQWARDLFEGVFRQPADQTNLYLTSLPQFQDTLKQHSNAMEMLSTVKACLVEEKPKHFEDCLRWARLQFESLFVNNIKQLLFNFPKDSVTSTGTLFWSGPKRAPNIISFDFKDPWHKAFVWYSAKLRAFNYHLPSPSHLDDTTFISFLDQVHVPEFQPKEGVKIQVNENEPSSNTSNATPSSTSTSLTLDPNLIEIQLQSIPPPSTFASFQMQPAVFEKDDDSNHHIDWITACSNIRAMTYSIATADRSKTKWIAGKIIPAIATTTALVTGLVCLELYKYLDNKTHLESYKNGFLSLAEPLLTFSEPLAPAKFTYGSSKKTFTLWDRFDELDQPLHTLLTKFESQHHLEITMMSCGVSMLYSFFMPAKKREERKKMLISEIYTSVTKKPLAEHVTSLILEVCCNDAEGNDVEVPYILIQLQK